MSVGPSLSQCPLSTLRGTVKILFMDFNTVLRRPVTESREPNKFTHLMYSLEKREGGRGPRGRTIRPHVTLWVSLCGHSASGQLTNLLALELVPQIDN